MTFVPSTILAQVQTLFVKQGTTLDRSTCKFNIPPVCLTGFTTFSILLCVVYYDQFFVKFIKKWTKNPRGITLLQRMGLGLFLLTIIMIISSLVEGKRLSLAPTHVLVESGAQVPLAVSNLYFATSICPHGDCGFTFKSR